MVESFGASLSKDAALTLKLRIDDNMCQFSVDTSGEGLHKRGHKSAVGKAPMRENIAALMAVSLWSIRCVALAPL